MTINIYHNLNKLSDGISSVLNNLGTSKKIINAPNINFSLLKNNNSRSIVFHGCYKLSIPFQILICKIINKKIYWMPHGSLQINSLSKSKFKKLIYHYIFSKFCINLCDLIIFTSNGERIKSSWITKDKKYKIIHNATPLIHEKEHSICNNKEKNNITYIGRIDEHHKGIDRFIDWLSCYNRPINIFGKILEKEKFNIGSLFFNGEINREEVLEELIKTRVFIMLSRYEGLPMSALEAFSAGCVVLCTDECNLSEFILEYQCGFVINNKKETVNILNYLFNEENNIILKKMQANSLRLANEKFCLKKQIYHFEKL